jgi:hypothetical protein
VGIIPLGLLLMIMLLILIEGWQGVEAGGRAKGKTFNVQRSTPNAQRSIQTQAFGWRRVINLPTRAFV